MKYPRRWIVCSIGLLAALGFSSAKLHFSTVRLQAKLNEQHRVLAPIRLEQERAGQNNQVLEKMGIATGDDDYRRRTAEKEIAELERHAEEQWRDREASKKAESQWLESNRDPSRGLTKVEYFQNVGRGSPAAAVQTLIWAAVQGDETELERGIVFDQEGRAAAEAFLAKLSDRQRKDFPTIERLEALGVSSVINDLQSAKIGEFQVTGDMATIQLFGNRESGGELLRLKQEPDGWKLHLNIRMVKALQRKLSATTEKR